MTNDKGTLHTSVMTQTDVLLVKCQLVLGFLRPANSRGSPQEETREILWRRRTEKREVELIGKV